MIANRATIIPDVGPRCQPFGMAPMTHRPVYPVAGVGSFAHGGIVADPQPRGGDGLLKTDILHSRYSIAVVPSLHQNREFQCVVRHLHRVVDHENMRLEGSGFMPELPGNEF